MTGWLKTHCSDSVTTLFISSMLGGYAIMGAILSFVEGYVWTGAAVSIVGACALTTAGVVAYNMECLLDKLRALTTPVVVAPPPEAVVKDKPRVEVTREPIGQKDRPPMTLRPERMRLLNPAEQAPEPEVVPEPRDRKVVRLVA